MDEIICPRVGRHRLAPELIREIELIEIELPENGEKMNIFDSKIMN